MRGMKMVAGGLLVLMSTSCGGGGSDGLGPSAQDINNSLEEILRSAAGDWTGISTGPNPIRLEFRLQESSNGQLTGTGTFKEEGAPTPVPVTVTGTYQRPVLTLAFEGIVYETQQVKGSVQGSYTTVGGIGAALNLTAPGYARSVQVLFQEK